MDLPVHNDDAERPPSQAEHGLPTLDIGGDSPLEITNFRPVLPEVTSARNRTGLVRALQTAGLLDDDAQHAVARALVAPELAGRLVREQQLVTETVEAATLKLVQGHVWTHELWPLIQPRTEAEALTVPHPRATGVVDADDAPQALLVLEFDSPDHLRGYVRQTVVHTRRTGNDYTASILSRQVGRPVIAHAVRVEFADGTPPMTVMAVRDGMTRLVSAVAARMGGNPSPDMIADTMATELMAAKAPRAGKTPDFSRDHARGREEIDRARRAQFAAGVAGGTPTETALRIGQTIMMPAQIYIGIEASIGSNLPAEEAFSEAVRAVIGSIHSEFKGWDAAAQAADVGARALNRARHAGGIPADVLAMATGALDSTSNADVFGDPKLPPTDLWRAVSLVAWLTGPPAYDAMKDGLRGVLGMTVIQRQRFASYLGPIIDMPWRSVKSRSLLQARRAWASGGGPIPQDLFGEEWFPVATHDFTTLIPDAVAGDKASRRTLQVAGAIALTADRLLASNVGSAVAAGEVPFRANPADIVTGLGASEAGLWQLARAAQVFRSDQPAINSFSERDFKSGVPVPVSYRVPAVDPDRPSRLRHDDAGQPMALTQYELVRLSDPARAARAERVKRTRDARAGRDSTMTPGQRADLLREDVASTLATVDEVLAKLLTLANGPDSAEVGAVFASHRQWSRVSSISNRVSALITVNKPDGTDTADGTRAHDDDLTEADTDTEVDAEVDADEGVSW